MSDILAHMGHTALGSRLKRAGMALQAMTQTWLEGQGCDLPAAQMPLLAALSQTDPRTTGELAQMLGMAQPGVSRMIDAMEKGGWVVVRSGDTDRRQRLIVLSDTGQALSVRAAREFWPRVNDAAARLCDGLDGDFLTQLTQLETRLRAGNYAGLLRDDRLPGGQASGDPVSKDKVSGGQAS